MRVALTGSSGMVGTALRNHLEGRGAEVIRLVRRTPVAENEVQWDPERGVAEPARLEACDAFVTLHGANIAGGRWTTGRKEILRASRVEGLRSLQASLADLQKPPKRLVSASGVGIYGARPEGLVDEKAPNGKGFLAELAADWEAAAVELAEQWGSRATLLRLGVVLSPAGGALAKMLPVYRLGLGGVVGSGDASMSWVALDDVVEAIRFVLEREVDGALNLVSPQPIDQRYFAKTLGRVLRRPTLFPVPAFALRLLLGEMAEETLLADQKVEPRRLLDEGYEFHLPGLEEALRHLLDRPS